MFNILYRNEHRETYHRAWNCGTQAKVVIEFTILSRVISRLKGLGHKMNFFLMPVKLYQYFSTCADGFQIFRLPCEREK
jgi:hypothetical protein